VVRSKPARDAEIRFTRPNRLQHSGWDLSPLLRPYSSRHACARSRAASWPQTV